MFNSAACILSDINMEKTKVTRQLFAGLAAALSSLCAGFHYGWPSPSLPKLLAADSDIPITSDQSSWIVSMAGLGSVFGPLIGAVIVDRLGKKWSILITVIPYLGSCILIAVAQGYWWFMAARFIAGIGMGLMYTVVPLYLGEIADDKIRGALGSIMNFMTNSGTLLTYCVGPWVSRVGLAGLGAAFPLIFGLMFIWMPESPYFLIMKGKPDRAEKSLLWLKGTKSVDEELKKIQESVEFDQKNSGTMKDLVMVPGNRKALMIVLGLIVAQQFSGITAVLSYSSQIFEASGSKLDSNISVILIGLTQLVSGVLTIFTIDLAGRRPLLLLSVCGVTLFLGGEALYFHLLAIGNDVNMISWLPVTALVGFMICYTIGLGSIPYVIVSEIFPCNVKALASMVITISTSIASVAVMKLYQVVADAFGIHVAFWGFAVITIFPGTIIYFVLPETKQRSFQSIQDELHKTTESTINLKNSEAA